MAVRQEFVQLAQTVLREAKVTPKDKLLFTYNEVLYPSILCSPEMLQAVGAFEAREDDVLLVAYPKCGSNWTIQLLYNMVHMSCNKAPPETIPILEFGAPEKIEKLKEESSPRVLATHLHYDNVPQKFFDKKVKMLVLFRNPKDTAVSLFHFYNNNPMLPTCSSWDEFFQDFMSGKVCWGSYFDHAIAWDKHMDDEGVFVITFEEMKQDLEGAIKKISDFFGFSLTQDQVQEIADKGTFKSMKEKSKESHGEFGQILFRKGDVGDWKNHFSESQSEEMDAKFEECLAGTKLGNMMNYNIHCKF